MIEHLTHLSNCHGEWTTLMGIPFLGAAFLVFRVKFHAAKVWLLTKLGRTTHCNDGHAHPCEEHTPKGFTLIELMIVVAIIGIILTIVATAISSSSLRTIFDRF